MDMGRPRLDPADKKPRSKVANSNRVSQKQWRKWDDQAKQLFNDVYNDVLRCLKEKVFLHPVSNRKRFTDEEFVVLAWNCAWTAANCLTNPNSQTTEVVLLSDDGMPTGEVIAVGEAA
jgi:hypothetical protein